MSRRSGTGEENFRIKAQGRLVAPNKGTDSSPISPAVHSPSNSISLADELDYVDITAPVGQSLLSADTALSRPDKASRILGVKHRRSMEPVPASRRSSIYSTRSARDPSPLPSSSGSPLTSLYVVSGLPKSPHTWTLSDPDSVLGLHHSEGAVNRWWRPEVLGSTVSPGAGGGKKKSRRGKTEELAKGAGALSKQEVGKMLSKALKLSFTREVEVIASTLQPPSTVHSFTFTLPAPNTALAPVASSDLLRSSVLTDRARSSTVSFQHAFPDDPFAAPSSAYLGPPTLLAPGSSAASNPAADVPLTSSSTVAYHGVCLTVWSHADAERSAAIRRTLEASRMRKESAQSIVASRIKNLRADASGFNDRTDPTLQARKNARRSSRGPWADVDTDGGETEAEGAMSDTDFDIASSIGGHNPGESTLFLPGDTVFWLPYALTLVSRHPVYDIMRDYLTLSWARFSKDVQSHTLQISKILAYPAPRAGELIKLDASPKSDGGDGALEVIARFPGGLDFGRGLVDINFTMWPLFKCLNIDNILTICEIALSPTGRVLFYSRYPAMLGIAVSTIKYLVELRGWNGIALPAVHSRDAKIYIDDPGPWIMGLATEARYSVRPAPEVCVCDLDMNYLSCHSPPPGSVSTKQQREKYRQRILAAFDSHYHPDHSIPSEFKEAFPAGRFRPVCKIQAKRAGSSAAAVADQIKPPEWWNSTRIIQAFDGVLQEKFKKPSFFKRISMFGSVKRQPHLTAAEEYIQLSIRKRAMAFVDARDDLETKIGRLSRRLNFLMTESDLWRDKFITFEQYAEKLSAEANQLRAKINKEQRETKRLSGLVTLTSAEKGKLQNQLKDTEAAHHQAQLELEEMKTTMEQMEQERSEMIAEVEAQIERALVSMTMGMDESDAGSSRPSSRTSNFSAPRSRKTSMNDSSARSRQRSFGTESTLAESYENHELKSPYVMERETTTIEEDDEEGIASPSMKRFSATEHDLPQDGMDVVDEGISQKSDKIAQKVLEIQHKLENALNTDKRTAKWRGQVADPDSDAELSGSTRSVRSRPPQGRKRHQRNTSTSTQTSRSSLETSTSVRTQTRSKSNKDNGIETPTRHSESRTDELGMTPEPIRESSSVSSTSTAHHTQSLHPVPDAQVPPKAMTDESDNDFQSAYSDSPRASRGDLSQHDDEDDEDIPRIINDMPDDFGPPTLTPRRRHNGVAATS